MKNVRGIDSKSFAGGTPALPEKSFRSEVYGITHDWEAL
jgi:hypothetical protein